MSKSHERERANILLPLLDMLLLDHPLPWTIERDWTHEVIARDGTIVAKCMNYDEAKAIIDRAEARQKEHGESGKEIEELFASMDGRENG